MHAMNWRIWLVGSFAAIAGCSTATDRSSERAPVESKTEPSFVKEIANARVTKALEPLVREKVAFRREGAGWVGGYHSYESKVSEFGEIAFTPKPATPLPNVARKARPIREQRIGDEARFNTLSIARGDVVLSDGALDVRE